MVGGGVVGAEGAGGGDKRMGGDVFRWSWELV